MEIPLLRGGCSRGTASRRRALPYWTGLQRVGWLTGVGLYNDQSWILLVWPAPWLTNRSHLLTKGANTSIVSGMLYYYMLSYIGIGLVPHNWYWTMWCWRLNWYACSFPVSIALWHHFYSVCVYAGLGLIPMVTIYAMLILHYKPAFYPWEGAGIIYQSAIPSLSHTHTHPMSMTTQLSSTTSSLIETSLYMQAVSTAFVA